MQKNSFDRNKNQTKEINNVIKRFDVVYIHLLIISEFACHI